MDGTHKSRLVGAAEKALLKEMHTSCPGVFWWLGIGVGGSTPAWCGSGSEWLTWMILVVSRL